MVATGGVEGGYLHLVAIDKWRIFRMPQEIVEVLKNFHLRGFLRGY
jgi:hypothetical protein